MSSPRVKQLQIGAPFLKFKLHIVCELSADIDTNLFLPLLFRRMSLRIAHRQQRPISRRPPDGKKHCVFGGILVYLDNEKLLLCTVKRMEL